MRKVKKFRDLSRSQRNRRLKLIQMSENFVPETCNGLNQKTSNVSLDQNIPHDVSEIILDHNICNNF